GTPPAPLLDGAVRRGGARPPDGPRRGPPRTGVHGRRRSGRAFRPHLYGSGALGWKLLAEVLQRGSLQARDVHLADAEPLGDLRLGHLVEEPHDHDPALPLIEMLHGPVQDLAHLDAVQVGVLSTHRLGELPAVILAVATGG